MTGLRDALRAAFRVWVFTTLGLFIPGLLGWINDVTGWARANGETPFPDARSLLFLIVAAITAAFPAAVAGVVRYLENLSGTSFIPRPSGPTVPVGRRRDRGTAHPAVVAYAVAMGAVLLLVAFAVQLR